MKVKTNFEYTGFTPKSPQKQINNSRRSSYHSLGQEFFDVNLPRRFTYFGFKLLRMQPRTAKYNRRKEKEHGHTNPFVWSGVSRDRILSSLTKIKAFATRNNSHVALTLNAPALNLRASSRSPNLRDEITRVANREVPPLERFLQKTMETNFQKLENSTV